MPEISLQVKLQLQAAQIERLHQDNVILTDMLTSIRAENLMLRNALEATNAEAKFERGTDEPNHPATDPRQDEDAGDQDGDDDGGACAPRAGSLPPLCDED